MNINIFKPIFEAAGLPYVGPYFTLLVFSFLLAFPLTAFLAPRFSLKSSRLITMTAIAIITSLFGSRLFHLLFDEQWERYATVLHEQGIISFLAVAFNPVSAGHVFYGGLAAAYGACYLLVRYIWREPTGRYADVAAFPIALGLAISRVGCFLAGCCFGRPTPFLGLSFPAFSPAANELYLRGVVDSYMEPTPPIIPTQLLESAVSFGIFVALVANLRRIETRAPGFFMRLLLFWYAVFRFFLEFFRADLRGSFLFFSTSQWVSLIILAILWFLRPHPVTTPSRIPSLLFAAFLFCVSPLSALPPDKPLHHLVSRRWDIPEGLPHANIAAIAQTPDHFVWLATPAGLVRFDGGKFFVIGERHLPGLADSRFTTLAVSSEGALWAGTEKGDIVRFHRAEGFTLFNRFRFPGFPDTPIITLATVDEAVLGTTPGSLICIRDKKWQKTDLPPPSNSPPLLVRDGEKRVVVIAGPDLLIWEETRRERVTFSRLVGTPVTAALFDTTGRLWTGTEQGEIIRFEHLGDTNGTLIRTADGIPITALISDGPLVWAGTRGKGLLRIASDGTIASFGTSHGLAGQSVRSLFRGNDGVLWVATEGGLQRFSDGPAITLTTQDGLSSNLTYALAETPDGSLWIGTRGGGLNRYKGGRFTVYTTKEGLPSNLIGGLFPDDDGSLWIGTPAGLAALHPTGTITTYTSRDGLPNPVIGAIIRDGNRNLWVGNLNGDMILVQPRAGAKNFRIFQINRMTKARQIYCIFEDRSGRLWVASQFGLALFNNGFIKVWGTEEGLPTSTVLTVTEDNDLNIWAGLYRGGVALVRENRVSSFGPRTGLPASDVFGILFDEEHDRIWLATDNGILYLSRRALLSYLEREGSSPVVRRLDHRDGAKATECTGGVQPVVLKGKDGTLYFSTLTGLVAVNPATVTEWENAPQAYIATVDIGTGPLLPGKSLILPAATRSFTIELGINDFDRRRPSFYRYRLDGVDNDWRETTDPSIRYNDIPPGAYRLIVQASYDRKTFGAAAEMPITIGSTSHRPLIIAITTGIGILALVLFVLFRMRRRAASYSPSVSAEREPQPAVSKPPESPPERSRYEKSRLDDDTARNLLEMLLSRMEKEKLYRDPDLTLPTLADKVGISHHLLSQLINDRLGKNFNTFVNEYRVNEVKAMLEDPANRDKLLAIAYDAGFRSKSTFNAFFKKCTGKTPSEYRKSLDGGEVVDHGEMQD